MKIILTITAILLMNYAVFAQQISYSLAQSKELALKNNVAVKNGELNLSSAKEGKLATKSAQLPTVSGTAVSLYGFQDFIGPTPGIAPSGVDNIYLAGATAMQTLYRGGRLKTNNKIADLQVDISQTRLKQSRDSVLLQTEQKYWQIYNLSEQYKALLFNEKYLDTLYKQQQDNLRAGLIAKNDLLRVKVQKNQVILNKLQTANRYQVALLDFCRFIGVGYDSLTVLSDTAYVISNPAELFVKPDVILKTTDNYKLLEKSADAEALQTQLRRADYLPSLSAGVSATQIGSFGKGIPGQFRPVALGTLSIPISSWLWGDGKHVMRQRKDAEAIAQNNLVDGGNQLQVTILQRWYNLNESYEQVILLKDNLASSAENLKATRDTYRAGLNNLTDVLNAQSDFQNVESQLAQANSNYLILLSEYKFIIGKTE